MFVLAVFAANCCTTYCFVLHRPCRKLLGACCPLQENYLNYDKGVLAEILEPIMGKGLIPADLETWKVRRRAIVPGGRQAPQSVVCHTLFIVKLGAQRCSAPGNLESAAPRHRARWAAPSQTSTLPRTHARRPLQPHHHTPHTLTPTHHHPSTRPLHPGFHKAYLDASVAMFGRVALQTASKLEALTVSGGGGGGGGAATRAAGSAAGAAGAAALPVVDLETEFLNLGLDIIGLGVFNYDFGSITAESPVIKVGVAAGGGQQRGGDGQRLEGAAAAMVAALAAGKGGSSGSSGGGGRPRPAFHRRLSPLPSAPCPLSRLCMAC